MAFSESIFCKVCSLARILLMTFVLISCLFFLYIFVAYVLFCQFIHTFLLKRYIFYGCYKQCKKNRDLLKLIIPTIFRTLLVSNGILYSLK